MPDPRGGPHRRPPCRWLGLSEALETFVVAAGGTEGAAHIHPLHWYVACRLVIEGGFDPDDVKPRPPFSIRREGRKRYLEHDAKCGGRGERTLFGGLKTKAVDVVVTKEGIGPVIAVSMKGTLKAFRNLTNRMEEAVGDCTNLHISYPALVYGFLHVIRATPPSEGAHSNDVAIGADGTATENIQRYHDVIARLTGRTDVRADPTRYEAVTLALVNLGAAGPARPKSHAAAASLLTTYPAPDSLLHFSRFFDTLYREYDQRFVYAAPALKSVTRRDVWSPQSPALAEPLAREYAARVGEPEKTSDTDDASMNP